MSFLAWSLCSECFPVGSSLANHRDGIGLQYILLADILAVAVRALRLAGATFLALGIIARAISSRRITCDEEPAGLTWPSPTSIFSWDPARVHLPCFYLNPKSLLISEQNSHPRVIHRISYRPSNSRSFQLRLMILVPNQPRLWRPQSCPRKRSCPQLCWHACCILHYGAGHHAPCAGTGFNRLYTAT